MSEEPVMDVAHLGHLELLTPARAQPAFFVDVMGHDGKRPQGQFGFSARLGRL